MAGVRVAVRVRPLSKRETKEGGKIIVEIDDKVAKIRNLKVDSRPDSFGDSREKVVAFSFDYCYWSVNPEDPQYASQDVVFQDLGTEVLSGAAEGYNICLFAYGQTGSGKTYTMLGTPASVGLTPRICEGLFIREEDCASLLSSCRIKVSFLEIYNERVRDLLKQSDQKKSYTLRVREHPEMGPYVQGLSQHVVTNYKQVIQLLEEGIANSSLHPHQEALLRTVISAGITAATHVHEASSRSHAIFTIYYSQAIVENNLPSEIASKINLVDLAGSERADPSYCKDRITEGANINKSLVTLGIVISTLAQNSQAFSSCQGLSSPASSSCGDNETPGAPGTSSGRGPSRRQAYIPYRDSVLTWLLKDSLGGNSKTIMVATVSPAHTSYSETMSTLRYASNAKNIINKPRVNEDANVKLIRELREEIRRLKAMLLSFELKNFNSLNDEDENLKELVLQDELKMNKLTKDWTQKWHDWQALVEHYRVDISRRRAGVVIDSSLPHLMALEDDVLSTGVALYHLKEGTTKIGRIDSDQEQDIVLQGQWIERDHCTITSACGVVILRPAQGARCTVNGREVTASCRLTQGAVITLGKAQKFRFSHPAEAAVLRRRRQVGEAIGSSGSLEWLDLDADVTASRLGLCPFLWKERRVLEEQSEEDHHPPRNGETSHRAQIQQQQCCVEELRQQIQAEQISAKKELEFDQTCTHQKIGDNQQWRFREDTWLAKLQKQQQQQQEDDLGAEKESEVSVAPDARLQTYSEAVLCPLVQNKKNRLVQLQLPQRRAPQAGEHNIPRKKASLQVDGFIKKQRLLEAQESLEQLRELCWLQDDSTHQSPCWVPTSDSTAPEPPPRNRRTSCSSLSYQRLLPPLHSAFLNGGHSTMLPPMPDPTHQVSEKIPLADHVSPAAACLPRMGCLYNSDLCPSGQPQLCMAKKDTSALGTCLTLSHKSVNIQEVERMGKQLSQMVSQGLASLCQSPDNLKSRDGPKTLTSGTQARRAKRLADSGNTQAVSQKGRNLGAHKAARGASYSYSYPGGPKQAAELGRVANTFRTESKLPFPGRESKRLQRVLAAKVRDIAKKYSPLPHGRPLKGLHSAGDPNTTASHTDSSPVMDCARGEDDLSDTDSSYSVDSLSCVYAKASLTEPLTPEDLPGKWYLPASENSESHNSQISEELLVEKGDQSSKERLGGSHPPNKCSHLKTRTKTCMRNFPRPLDSSLLAESFSLDSLIDAEEELEEDQQEEPCLGSADEMPTEIFWHRQNSILPVVDQEAMCRPGPISHRAGTGLSAILPVSSSFYLNPQVQPDKEQSESEMEASYPERASSFQGIQLSRESSLVSMDSWFSCDSKINPSSPGGVQDSLLLSPDVQEVQPYDEEKPGCLRSIKELKPPAAEAVLPDSLKLPQGNTELACTARDVHTTSASDISKLSLRGTQRLLQPGADDLFQGRASDTTQQGNSEVSNSSVSSGPAASATSFTYVGSTHEEDWATLQQKFILELSHPVSEAIREPRPPFLYLEEDSSSLAENSSKGGDTQQQVGSGISSSLNFNDFPVHLSKTSHLRAEKEQDSLSATLESASDFLSTSEKEVGCNGAYSADLESLASGFTNIQVCVAENKITYSLKEACEVRQKSLEGCYQDSRKTAVITSSDTYVFQKNACCRNVLQATNADHWPQGQSPLRKNSSVQRGQLSHNNHHFQQKKKADYQESSEEVVGRHTDVSFASLSDPEPHVRCAPWNPFSSSPQPPILETFYVTKSRDALTETALEIPARREVWVPSPPPREAWGFSHDHQVLQKTYLNSLPVLLQNRNSKVAFSQQVTAERPVDLNTKEVTGKLGECAENTKEGSHNSVHFLVAQNRHIFSFTGTEVPEHENEFGILNKKHSLPVLNEKEKAPTQPCWDVFSDSSGSGKPFLFICEPEAGRKEEQAQIQAHDMSRQIPFGPRSDFICKTTDLGLEKDMPGETAVFMKSGSVCHGVSSPMIIAQDESPTHKWGEKSETGLLGGTVHPTDSPAEPELSEIGSTCESAPSVTCYQESCPIKCQGPRGSQEMLNSKDEFLGKKQYKGVSNADEMARLIRSVMQLENGILEIGSKQNKQLHASHTSGVSEEVVSQDQKDQESSDHVLRPGSSGNHLSYKDQSSFPRQAGDVVFGDSEAGEMEANRTTGNENQVQKIPPGPSRSRECVQQCQRVVAHTRPAGADSASRDTCDLGKGAACKEPTDTALHQRRMKALSRAPSLHPWPESSGKEVRLVQASASFEEQPWGLGNLEDLETMEVFQDSQVAECISDSKPDGLRAQSEVEEMALHLGRGPKDKSNMVSLTQEHPGPNQHCTCTCFSQETVSLPSHTDFSTAPSNQDWSNTLPLPSPRLPGSCFHGPDIIGISSVDHVLDPTILKIPDSPLEHGVGCDSQSRENRSPHLQGDIRRGSSMAYTAWCGDVRPMALGLHGQSDAAENVPLGTEEQITASTSQDRGDLEITSLGLTAQESFGNETEAAGQKEIQATSSNMTSRELEKQVSLSLEEGNDQGRGAKCKTQEEAKDQGPVSRTCSGSVSMPKVPDPEPILLETSVHASICLAILEEIRQANIWRKWPNDFGTGGTVLTDYEPSVEPERSSGAAGRTQCEQMDQLMPGRTRSEGEAPECHVASVFATPGHLLADERKAQAMPVCIDGSGPLPSPEMNRGLQLPPQSSSHAAPAPGKRCYPRDLRLFQEAKEGFSDHSGSPGIIAKKKQASRTFSSAGPLMLDRLLPSGAVEADRIVGSEKAVSALSSYDDPGPVLCGQNQLATRDTVEGMSPGSRTGSPEHREPEAVDTTYGAVSGNFSVTAQGGKTAHFESQSVSCSVGNSSSSSATKQDQVQCHKASTGLEEVRASPKQQAALPGAPRNAEVEAGAQQGVRWEENVWVRPAEACRTENKNLSPTPSPDPRGDEAPCGGLGETEDCIVFSGSTEGSSARSTVREAKESGTIPCQQSCYHQTTATRTCQRDGDWQTNSQAAPYPVYPPFIAPSRAHEMSEIGKTSFKEADILLAHSCGTLGPADGSMVEPLTAAAIRSPTQGCNSLGTSYVRTHSLSESATDRSLRTVGGPEEEVAKKKASTELEAAPCPAGTCSEPLRNLRDHSVGGHSAQVSQTKPEPPTETQGPHTLRLSEGSLESEHGCLENTKRLSEKPNPSTECRDPLAKCVAKHICSPQGDSPWEDQEQQRDSASVGGEALPQGRNPPLDDQGGLNGYHIRGAAREEVAVTTFPVSQSFLPGFGDPASVLLGHSEVPQPVGWRPGRLYPSEEQPTPHHGPSLPVITVFSGSKHCMPHPRPQFSVVNSQSLQELHMRVEPPPPPDEDAQGLHRLWHPHIRDCSSGKMVTETPLKTEDSNPSAPSNLSDGPAEHMPLKHATPPYPVSSTVSSMPTSDFMNSWVSSTLALQRKPEKLGVQVRSEDGQVEKGMLYLGSKDINRYISPWCPEGPVHIGWKQCVFDRAADVSCSLKAHGPRPSNVAQCSSMDNVLGDQNPPFYSHLSTYSQTQDLSSTHSSTENVQDSNEAWNIRDASFALGDILSGPDKITQLKGATNETGCLKSGLPLAEGSSVGAVDEVVLLYPSETGSPVAQAKVNTYEQGTQTLGCQLPQSCVDVLPAQPDTSEVSPCDLASWASMHNLSLHLSQLLQSTSELLGSLSQPSVAKEHNTKRDPIAEALQALRTDRATQTSVEKDSQAELASPSLHPQAPEAKTQEVSVIVEVLSSDTASVSQEKGDVTGALESDTEEMARKATVPSDLLEESTPCALGSPPVPSPHLRFQRAPQEQKPSLSPPASLDASQPGDSCCVVVHSPGLSTSRTPGPSPSASEPTREPQVQRKPGPMSACLVDRASSPILTLSASTQEPGPTPGILTLSAPSACPPEGHQKLDFSLRPPADSCSQITHEPGGSQTLKALDGKGSSGKSVLELSCPCSPPQSLSVQVSFLGQPVQQPEPRTITGGQSSPPVPPSRYWSQRLTDSFLSEEAASPEQGPLSSQWQSRPENWGECSAPPVEPQLAANPSSWKGSQHLGPSPGAELTDPAGMRGCTAGLPQVCQLEEMCPSSQICVAPEPQHCSLRELPVHNKFSNWYRVQHGSSRGLGVSKELEVSSDLCSGEQKQMLPQPGDRSVHPEWSPREQVSLQVGAQSTPLSIELTEAKLHRGFGEADALLQVLQRGTGAALAPDEAVVSTWEEHHARQKQVIETLKREQAERLHTFRRTRSLSPQKQLSLLPNRAFPSWDLDLPSKRREYLQQLRKDVVETTRSPESALSSAHPPTDMEQMLRNYQQAREEAKVEIARARKRLRERTTQEKLRIRQQIISQLLREEEKLHALASSSSLCTSSNGSLSSGVTSGYNSSPALAGQLPSPESVRNLNLGDSGDTWMGDGRSWTSTRNSNLYLAGSAPKSTDCSHRGFLGSCCCAPSSLSSLGTCFSSSYQDLAQHIVDTSMADVMAACSDNLHNLFSRQATAGWNYQGEEQEVQLYYKEFSSTRHGFLGAGVVAQPLSHVWAAVSDPTLWPLYHKPIQTARLHQRVTNSISLVYLVCSASLCALKQPRDFCCVCVEAKEGHLCVLAAQSVYDTSMPRPRREMVRGEILPSAWILQPVTVEGKEITRVIYLAQVELGAPGFPPHVLSSFIKQQPLIVARLASFLGS
ncbi:PREDICTED: stAR-related lipid transfer protein 9 isoform X2 [Chinchilla lanigera]|uniref:stAR-related lipid transfer protein 9 isoform X2 n=1 Tax=Chinchilla lanigera TaxID=34839 RepID=UPI0006974A9A|nr:PREDICTED: stAR-related lipid transfer protein 9 isoform X2 [Chinchilla lanigera]